MSDKGKEEEEEGEVKERRQKRRKAGGSLGEALAGESGGSAASWVKKLGQRRDQSILSRLEEQEEKLAAVPVRAYTGEDVAGLRVLHDAGDLAAGEEVVLTLADRNVLDDGEEALESSQLRQQEKQRELERYKKSKGRPVYDVFDHDAPVLQQYDEAARLSFRLGGAAEAAAAAQRLAAARARAEQEASRLAYDASAAAAASQVASDFLGPEEMAKLAKRDRKKEKKEKKAQRRGKKATSELLADLEQERDAGEEEEQDRGSAATAAERRRERTEEGRLQELLEKEARYKAALQSALQQTRAKLYEQPVEEKEEAAAAAAVAAPAARRERASVSVAEKLAQRARAKKERERAAGPEGGGLVFSSAAEFVRQVKVEDEPARKEAPVKREKEAEAVEEKASKEEEKEEGEVEVEEGEVGAEPERALPEEPDVGQGLAATLHYLQMRGGAVGEREGVVARLQDGSVSRRHRAYDDGGEEEEEAKGAAAGSEGLPPGAKVDLQKYDEFGRPVSRKEAFRLLSQGFHGNAPGARKQEKRLKQVIKEKKAKQKLSTEATLKTLEVLEKRQKESGMAGIEVGMDTARLEELQEETRLRLAKKAEKKKSKKMA